MIELHLIGIGTGNPDHLTFQAVKALNAADLVLIPRKGETKADLAGLRRQICDTMLTNPATRVAEFDLPVRDSGSPSYRQGVDDWHDAIAEVWREALRPLGDTGRAALLIWGDPSLYDSSLRIAERLGRQIELRVQVVPGLTALQVLTAAHAIALNDIGAPVLITTGRRLRDEGLPAGVDRLAVFLDGDCSFMGLDPAGIHIWWGAFVGMPEQILMAGPLAEVGPRIVEARARARAEHGWIMDIYLLARQPAR